MRAAVVHDYGEDPVCEEVAEPEPQGLDELVVDLAFSALSPRVKSQASGGHYTSHGELPLTPGIDGVGRDAAGVLRYFVLPDTPHGAMAERVLIDARRSVVLPDDVDPLQLAVAMNPAMSSWLALRHRARPDPGFRVLVLGASGNAGRLAVDVARRLGASHVTAVGRGAERMAELPADTVVSLDQEPERLGAELAAAGADVDVVLDYLWGEPTAAALRAIVPHRSDDDRPLRWVQIGSVAGTDCPVPSAALRATNLQLSGSGQGSVSTRTIVAELGELAACIGRGELRVPARAVPLAQVRQAWSSTADPGVRLAIHP